MVKTLVLLSLSIFVLYIAVINVLLEDLTSISISSYRWREKNKAYLILFIFFCWGVAFTLLPAWLELTPDALKVVPFMASAGLVFVGGTPLYKKIGDDSSLEGRLHLFSAFVCGALSIIWTFALGSLILSFLALFIIVIFVMLKLERNVYYVEVVLFIHLYTQLLLKINEINIY